MKVKELVIMLSKRHMRVFSGLLLAFSTISTFSAISYAGGVVPPDALPALAQQLGAVQADTDSVIVIDIDGWDTPLYVGIVTLGEEPLVTTLNGEQIDANGPVRVATTLVHPESGDTYNVNIIQVIQRNVGTPERPIVELQINQEYPFTRATEVSAAVQGQSVRKVREYAANDAGTTAAASVDFMTGEPVLDLYVWHVAMPAGGGDSNGRPPVGYGLVVRTLQNPFGTSGLTDVGDGGDPGGSPDPPAAPTPPQDKPVNRRQR